MKARHPPSLRTRLAVIMTTLFLLGMVALYLAAQGYGRAAADRSFDRLLAGSAISISETVSIVGNEIRVDVPYAALDMLSAAPDDRVFYRVVGPDDQTITGYADLPMSAAGNRADQHSENMRFFDSRYRGELVRFALVSREIAVGGNRGWVSVQVGQTRLAREVVARETVIGAIAPIAAMTLLAICVVWFAIGGALRPLRRIGAEIAQRPPADLSPIEAPVPAELRPLVDAMNGFMRRLADNIDTLKNFIADASHQMRTPLAALLAQTQAAHGDKPRELRQSLQAIERNGSKLAHLLNQLLSDATVAHRTDMRAFDPVDLLDVLREAIRETAGTLEGSHVSLRTRLSAALIQGDRLVLVEAFKNLIHNALWHGCGVDQRVELELIEEKTHYLVRILDRGPGIPLKERERVFERFARVDTATQGAGIGLAIVRRGIESHHGSVALLDRPGGGLMVEVRVPM